MSRTSGLFAAAAITAAAILALASLKVEASGATEQTAPCAAVLCSFVIF